MSTSAKRLRPVVVCVCVVLWCGCTPKDDGPSPASAVADKVGQAMAEVAESVSDPADKTADALALRWDEVQAATYSDRVRTRTILDRMAAAVSERMEDLERRRSPAAHGARQHWESGLAELRQAHAALQYQIKELDCATEDTWDEAKIELATAWERVREAYLDLEASRTSS